MKKKFSSSIFSVEIVLNVLSSKIILIVSIEIIYVPIPKNALNN